MVGCLILYHDSITSITKSKILRSMFHKKEFEIHVQDHRTVVLYVWDMEDEKEEIWQAAANFASTNIIVGYGFGKRKQDAKEAANEILNRWG